MKSKFREIITIPVIGKFSVNTEEQRVATAEIGLTNNNPPTQLRIKLYTTDLSTFYAGVIGGPNMPSEEDEMFLFFARTRDALLSFVDTPEFLMNNGTVKGVNVQGTVKDPPDAIRWEPSISSLEEALEQVYSSLKRALTGLNFRIGPLEAIEYLVVREIEILPRQMRLPKAAYSIKSRISDLVPEVEWKDGFMNATVSGYRYLPEEDGLRYFFVLVGCVEGYTFLVSNIDKYEVTLMIGAGSESIYTYRCADGTECSARILHFLYTKGWIHKKVGNLQQELLKKFGVSVEDHTIRVTNSPKEFLDASKLLEY